MDGIDKFLGRPMITMTVDVKVKPEKRKEFLDAMHSLQEVRMKEKGIRGSNLYENENPTTFRLMDEWETEEDLDRYCQQETFRVFIGALKTLCAEAKMKYRTLPREGGQGSFTDYCWEDGWVAQI